MRGTCPLGWLTRGCLLLVPMAAALATAACGDVAPEPREGVARAPTSTAARGLEGPVEPATYVVQPGDYLAAIARRLDISLTELITLNEIADPALIEIGQVLLLPALLEEAPAPPLPGRPVLTVEQPPAQARSLPLGLSRSALLQGAAAAVVLPAAVLAVFVLGATTRLGWRAGRFGLRGTRWLASRRAHPRRVEVPAPQQRRRRLTLQWQAPARLARRTCASTGRRILVLVLSAARGFRRGVDGAASATRVRLQAAGRDLRRAAVHPAVAATSALQAASRRAAGAPAGAARSLRRRRGGFEDGGTFWVRGAELLRLGFLEQARAHFQGGYYACEPEGWAPEAGRCLERLAHVAELQGDPRRALRFIEQARALTADVEVGSLSDELAARHASMRAALGAQEAPAGGVQQWSGA